MATTWKITPCSSSDRGAPMFYGDILGDWREEVICTGSDYASLVILSTTVPTQYRNECLAQDPCYRNCMTAKGYYQSHMLDYYLGTGMKTTKAGTAMNTAVNYTIQNRNSSLYLAVDGKTDNGTNIGIYSNTKSDAQLFKLVDNADGTYTIATKVTDDSSCLGVDGMSKNEGANVLEWKCAGTDDHKCIVSPKVEPMDSTLIKALTIQDMEHYNAWGLVDSASAGSVIYGDRDFTFTSLPKELEGAEGVLTACDAKKTNGDLATFTAGADITTYVLLDQRVTTVPDWLTDWTNTTLTAQASNDVTYVIYSKAFAKGERVLLGTNGMSGSCVNYTVLVTAAHAGTQGDLNADGELTIADILLLQRWLLAVPDTTLPDWKAGDLSGDNQLDAMDLCLLKRSLAER